MTVVTSGMVHNIYTVCFDLMAGSKAVCAVQKLCVLLGFMAGDRRGLNDAQLDRAKSESPCSTDIIQTYSDTCLTAQTI